MVEWGDAKFMIFSRRDMVDTMSRGEWRYSIPMSEI